jgi:hypothetical protein
LPNPVLAFGNDGGFERGPSLTLRMSVTYTGR